MAKIIKEKFSQAYIDQYISNGPCLKPGMELWYLQGKKLSMGTVVKITPGENLEILKPDGSIARLNPDSPIEIEEMLNLLEQNILRQTAFTSTPSECRVASIKRHQ